MTHAALRIVSIDVFNTAQTTSRSTAHTPLTKQLTNIPWSLPKCCFSITSAQTMPHNPPKRDSFADVSFPKSSQLLHGPFFCGGSVTRLQLQAPNTSQSWTIRIMKNIRMLSSHGGAQLFGQKISSSTVSNAKTSRVVRLLTEERESGLLRSCAPSDRGITICPSVSRFHILSPANASVIRALHMALTLPNPAVSGVRC